MKKLPLIILIFILMVLGSIRILQYIKNQNYKSELKSQIADGLKFYSPDVVKNFKRIDSYFFLQEIAKHTNNEAILLNGKNYDKLAN